MQKTIENPEKQNKEVIYKNIMVRNDALNNIQLKR